ncbi:hypothetical protein CYLTODRAFT_450990 [Cylindrobasidium torrendii FP15055 ss-10]|uniref:Uncharacterized protein n=1 Tax=Cylindrobasidium torrendii FP15055 ss-10 TaxID=1314674 RepID=A0A0D7BKW5_9AGAR|nr:hypothetical protein CYLTODRAFT_450990 [Cylindrobasidium torrendii FP15055 ss-10]
MMSYAPWPARPIAPSHVYTINGVYTPSAQIVDAGAIATRKSASLAKRKTSSVPFGKGYSPILLECIAGFEQHLKENGKLNPAPEEIDYIGPVWFDDLIRAPVWAKQTWRQMNAEADHMKAWRIAKLTRQRAARRKAAQAEKDCSTSRAESPDSLFSGDESETESHEEEYSEEDDILPEALSHHAEELWSKPQLSSSELHAKYVQPIPDPTESVAQDTEHVG